MDTKSPPGYAWSMAKMGRPKLPKGQRKQETFSLRFTTAERKALDAAAKAAKKTVSEWARDSLLIAAASARQQ